MTEGTAALRDLVLMMREDQVEAAGMDVEGLAQMLGAHRRAFDVPARPPPAPRTRPSGLGVGRGLPQHEVGGVLLVGSHFDAGAGDQLVTRATRQAAVVVHAGHAEQHVAVGGVGMAVVDQALDHADHLGDILRGTRLDVGRQRAQPAHVALIGVGRAIGQCLDALAVIGGADDDAVVDVGDVAHIGDARIAPLQQAVERVEHHDGPRIADVHVIVDRRAADVEAHVPCIERNERLFFARQRIVDDEGHGPLLPDQVCTKARCASQGAAFTYIARLRRREAGRAAYAKFIRCVLAAQTRRHESIFDPASDHQAGCPLRRASACARPISGSSLAISGPVSRAVRTRHNG